MTDTSKSDGVRIVFRADSGLKDRLAGHADKAPFNGNESLFARTAIELVMNLRDALGPRFEMEIARLFADASEQEGRAA